MNPARYWRPAQGSEPGANSSRPIARPHSVLRDERSPGCGRAEQRSRRAAIGGPGGAGGPSSSPVVRESVAVVGQPDGPAAREDGGVPRRHLVEAGRFVPFDEHRPRRPASRQAHAHVAVGPVQLSRASVRGTYGAVDEGETAGSVRVGRTVRYECSGADLQGVAAREAGPAHRGPPAIWKPGRCCYCSGFCTGAGLFSASAISSSNSASRSGANRDTSDRQRVPP